MQKNIIHLFKIIDISFGQYILRDGKLRNLPFGVFDVFTDRYGIKTLILKSFFLYIPTFPGSSLIPSSSNAIILTNKATCMKL